MTAKDAAEKLEISLATVYSLCRSGELTHMRVGHGGRAIRLEQSDIDDYKRRARARAMPPEADEDQEDVLTIYGNFPPRALEDCRRRRP